MGVADVSTDGPATGIVDEATTVITGCSGLFSAQAASKTNAARIKLPRRTRAESLLMLPPLATQLFLQTNGRRILYCGPIAYGAENSEVLPEPSMEVAVRLGPVSGPPT